MVLGMVKINLWSCPAESGLLSISLQDATLWQWKWQSVLVQSSCVTCRLYLRKPAPVPVSRTLETIHHGERTRATNLGLVFTHLLARACLAGQGSERPVSVILLKIPWLPPWEGRRVPARQDLDVTEKTHIPDHSPTSCNSTCFLRRDSVGLQVKAPW